MLLEIKVYFFRYLGKQNQMKILLLFFIFSFYPVEGKQPSISFSILSNQETSQAFLNKEIEIRGFLYQDLDKQWILCPMPNLKTCCLQKVQSIRLIDLSTSETTFNHAVNVQGILKINTGAYTLENSTILQSSGNPFHLLGILAAGTILIIAKKKLGKRKDT